MEAFKIIRLQLSKLQVELLSMVPVQAKTQESSSMRHSDTDRNGAARHGDAATKRDERQTTTTATDNRQR